jgi:prophage tail gpP-like protein
MQDEKDIRVTKVTTSHGVYYTREVNATAKFFGKPDVTSVQEVTMKESDFDELEVTDTAKRFFEGKAVGSRAE